MEKIMIALGSGKTDSPEIAQLYLNVAQTIKQLEKWPKLNKFLLKLFLRPEMRTAPPKTVAYLSVVFDQLSELLEADLLDQAGDEEPQDLEVMVFDLLVRYNFNHESVYKFYRSEINDLVASGQDKPEQVLRTIRIHCEVPPRRDMAYNDLGNTLGEDLIGEIDRRLDMLNLSGTYFRPIDVGVPANVFIPLMGLFIDAGLLTKPLHMNKFYESLSKAFRSQEGRPFAVGTIRARIGGNDDQSNLEECRAFLDRATGRLADKMKDHTRRLAAVN